MSPPQKKIVKNMRHPLILIRFCYPACSYPPPNMCQCNSCGASCWRQQPKATAKGNSLRQSVRGNSRRPRRRQQPKASAKGNSLRQSSEATAEDHAGGNGRRHPPREQPAAIVRGNSRRPRWRQQPKARCHMHI